MDIAVSFDLNDMLGMEHVADFIHVYLFRLPKDGVTHMDMFALTTQEVLERISRHCPEALSTYLQCLNRCDNAGTVHFSKEMVDVDLSYEWPRFRKDIKKLALENLLLWSPLDGGISVTVADVG